jgi:hypothetical protein
MLEFELFNLRRHKRRNHPGMLVTELIGEMIAVKLDLKPKTRQFAKDDPLWIQWKLKRL